MTIIGEYSPISSTKALFHLNGNSINTVGSKTSTETNITYVPGKFDQCASFNEIDSVITYADIGTLTTFTISLWINTTSISNCPLCQSGQYNNGFFFQIDNVGKVDFELWNGGASTHLYSTVSINDGNWHNIIVTRSGATVNLYIDGNFNNQSTTMYTFTIGNYYRTFNKKLFYDGNFNGKLDEIIIDNTVWTSNQIKNYYDIINDGKSLGQFLPTPNTNGLFKLNGNSNNSIGNIASTDSNITYVPGRYGQCASFNGSNSFIYLGTSSIYNPTYMTVNAWVKPASLSSNMDIISRDNTTSKRSYNINILSNGSVAAEIFTTSSISSGIVNVTGTTGIIEVNKWYMISFTFDGITAKLYINGKLYGSSFCSAIYPQTVETYIGKRRISDNAVVFNGQMDEIIIENRAWSENEVRKYYTNYLGRFAIL